MQKFSLQSIHKLPVRTVCRNEMCRAFRKNGYKVEIDDPSRCTGKRMTCRALTKKTCEDGVFGKSCMRSIQTKRGANEKYERSAEYREITEFERRGLLIPELAEISVVAAICCHACTQFRVTSELFDFCASCEKNPKP